MKHALNFIVFAGLIAVSLAFGAVAFYRALGVVTACYGAVVAIVGYSVPVGVEGRKPSVHLTGYAARAVALAVVAIGVTLAWFAPQAACMFSEGRQCS